MTNDGELDERESDEPRTDDHLENVPDGCGCTEVWEHLSEKRGANRSQ